MARKKVNKELTIEEQLQQERENGEFISKEDLQKRTKISKTVIETLTIHGSLDNMSEKNQLSLF